MTQLQTLQQSVNILGVSTYSGVAMADTLVGLPQVEAGKSFSSVLELVLTTMAALPR
ncbi:hypothetical protein [Trinickia violacea]|uniref:hypothetical protein n=1 Tax=Trinickia violacea TaxID=2571746 RepID=UPI0020C78620|nr:hypothetical protein [Trinickia violacea]